MTHTAGLSDLICLPLCRFYSTPCVSSLSCSLCLSSHFWVSDHLSFSVPVWICSCFPICLCLCLPHFAKSHTPCPEPSHGFHFPLKSSSSSRWPMSLTATVPQAEHPRLRSPLRSTHLPALQTHQVPLLASALALVPAPSRTAHIVTLSPSQSSLC